jgi:hypothetical protein
MLGGKEFINRDPPSRHRRLGVRDIPAPVNHRIRRIVRTVNRYDIDRSACAVVSIAETCHTRRGTPDRDEAGYAVIRVA